MLCSPDFTCALLCLLPLCPDALQQHGGGLVVGVLGNEFACKGLLEDALAQGFGFFEVGFDVGFEAIANRKPRFDFFNDLFLLSP